MKQLVIYFVFTIISVAQCQQPGTVALLVNGESMPSLTSGIVQVYNGNSSGSMWGGICSTSSFTLTEASVICHQLGYTDAESFSTAQDSQFGSIDAISYTDVSCSNEDYQVLFQCDVSESEEGSCNTDQAVTVVCSSDRVWDDPYTGQVRLRGGNYTSEGIVEIYCNDEWGTVCYSNNDDGPGEVICDQLGYNNFVSIGQVSRNRSQSNWLSDVDCNGLFSSTCLTNCQSCPSVARGCTSGNIASIECSYELESNDSTNTLGTCDFTELVRAIGRLIGIIVGVIVACCAISIFLAVLPFCICCCLGVGVGAAAARA